VKFSWWKIIHWIIIINLVAGALYDAYMVFFVVGGGMPLFEREVTLPLDILLRRRLFALETWVITAGLVVYLAITEFLPRKLSQSREHRS
jgi:hypothetical protein